MMHVDVVGGSGFIGTRLCQRLSQKKALSFNIVDKEPSREFPGKVLLTDVRIRGCAAEAYYPGGCVGQSCR